MSKRTMRQIVEEGYNIIADALLNWGDREPSTSRPRFTGWLIDRLVPGASVLDLGCGAGLPTAQLLSRSFNVTGIDISAEQIARARQNVQSGTFIHADMTTVEFDPASFDAIVALYTIFHLPREEHADLFHKIARWLKPGGLFVAALGAKDEPLGTEDNWLGAPMAWSSFDADTNRRLVEQAGMTIVEHTIETVMENEEPASFLWIAAEKHGGRACPT